MAGGDDARGASREEGVVAILVAMLLGVFLIVGALTIDLGALFTTRQDLVGDLDAAALAAAIAAGDHVFERVPAAGRCGPSHPNGSESTRNDHAYPEVDDLLDANGSTVSVGSDDIVVDCPSVDGLTVTVRGRQDSPRFLAGSEGDLAASGSSTARYVPPVGGTFLPLTICGEDPAIADWLLSDPVAPQQTGPVRTVELRDGDTEPCGEVPGNWGWFGSSNASTISSWIAGGLPTDSVVGFDPPRCTIDDDEGPGGWCQGGPGLEASLLDEAVDYECVVRPNGLDCEVITLLVHGDATASGSNALYEPIGFLDVRLRSIESTGPSMGEMEIEFRAFRGGPDEAPFTPSGSYLCDVDIAPAGHDWCTQ